MSSCRQPILSRQRRSSSPDLVSGVADVNQLQAESDETFDRTKIVVELSSTNPFKAKAVFKHGLLSVSPLSTRWLRGIKDGGEGPSHYVTPDGGTAQYDVLRDPSFEPVVPLQTMAPSFSPAVAGAVPKISVVLDVDSTSLPKLELAALTVGFLNKLQAESDETFDRTNIVVELSSTDPIKAEVVLKPGSGVGTASPMSTSCRPSRTRPLTGQRSWSNCRLPILSRPRRSSSPDLVSGVADVNQLQAESDETFDRTKIVVELSSTNPFKAKAVFKPGSGVGCRRCQPAAGRVGRDL